MSNEVLSKMREEYIGKIMTIEEMREAIPGVWVAIRATEYDPESADNILQGKVLGVSDDNNVEEELQEYEDSSDKDIRVIRTTYGMDMGWIDGILIKTDNR